MIRCVASGHAGDPGQGGVGGGDHRRSGRFLLRSGSVPFFLIINTY